MYKKITLIFLVVLFNNIFSQNTYYISPSGNDKNNGLSDSSPLNSIAKVNAIKLKPGDVVLFERGGVYSDARLIMEDDGANGNKIVYSNYGNGEKPIIGNKKSTYESSILITGDHIILDGLIIYGTNNESNEMCNGINISSDYVTVQNCYFEGGTPNSLNLTSVPHRRDGFAIRDRGNGIGRRYLDNEISYWGNGIYEYKPNDLIIHGNTFRQIHEGNSGWQGPPPSSGSSGDGGVCLFFAGSTDKGGWDCEYGVVISNNDFGEYERWGIAMSSMSNVIVEKNHFHDNLDERTYSGGVRHGNAVKLHDRLAGGVKGDGSVGNIFRYNVVNDLQRHQTSTTYNSNQGEDFTITWYGTVVGGSGIDFIIHNNIFYNTAGGLAEMADSYYGYPMSSPNFWAEIYNNTVWNVGNDELSSATINIANDKSPDGQFTKMKVKNNIIYDGYVDRDQPVARTSEKLVEGNNIIYNSGLDYSYLGDKDHLNNAPTITEEVYAWTRWKGSLTIEGDATLLDADPLFTDRSGTFTLPEIGVNGVTIPNFTLLNSSSPAYDGGADVGNDPTGVDMNIDITGRLRTTNDIGALGLVSTSGASPGTKTEVKPIITSHPINIEANNGETISFSVVSTGTAQIGYQWWTYPIVSVSESKIVNNNKYSGATTNTLTISNLTDGDANLQYFCEVYNTTDRSNLWLNSNIVSVNLVGGDPTVESETEGLLILLEGSYSNGKMNNILQTRKSLPITNPYSLNTSNSNDNLTSNENIIDWVIVELRSDFNIFVVSKTAVVTANGIIINPNGSNFSLSGINDGSYYLVIRHRNHLDIMSSNKISVKNNKEINYDFTVSGSKAFGINPMAKLDNGKFAMYAGDADQNNIINNLDFGGVANNIPSQGYHNSDLDLNNVVNVLDYDKINKNILKSSYVPK